MAGEDALRHGWWRPLPGRMASGGPFEPAATARGLAVEAGELRRLKIAIGFGEPGDLPDKKNLCFRFCTIF